MSSREHRMEWGIDNAVTLLYLQASLAACRLSWSEEYSFGCICCNIHNTNHNQTKLCWRQTEGRRSHKVVCAQETVILARVQVNRAAFLCTTGTENCCAVPTCLDPMLSAPGTCSSFWCELRDMASRGFWWGLQSTTRPAALHTTAICELLGQVSEEVLVFHFLARFVDVRV